MSIYPRQFCRENPSTDFTFSIMAMVSDLANGEASRLSWPSLSNDGKGFACSGAFLAVLAAKTPSETALSAPKPPLGAVFRPF